MAAGRFTISTREWNERSYFQGLHILSDGTSLAIDADPAASGETFEVHARTSAGKYLGKARVGYGHGSSVGVEMTSPDACNLWYRDERAKATGYAAYKIGQTGTLTFTKVSALPFGDVAIDQDADLICVRSGSRYRGYKLSAAHAGKAEKVFDFTIPSWGNRWQGMLVFGGRLFVHRDVATKAASKAHVFDYQGKQLAVIDTTKMGDEAEGFVEIDGTVYAVKRTGGTGPSRVIVVTPLDFKVEPPKPPNPWPKATGDKPAKVYYTKAALTGLEANGKVSKRRDPGFAITTPNAIVLGGETVPASEGDTKWLRTDAGFFYRLDGLTTTDPTPPEPPKPPAPSRLRGVDVSSYQPGWQPATNDTFVFVKATEGTSYTNPERAKQLAAGRDKGLLVGHYHWLVPGKPLEQAAYFVKNADIRTGDLLWCDWEKQADGKYPTIQDVAAFIAEVQRLVPTSKVGLYCNRSDWVSTSVKAGDGLWIAEYGVSKPNTATDWVFWQYTDKPIDQNWAKFTNPVDLLRWAQVDRTPAVKPPVVVVEPEPPVQEQPAGKPDPEPVTNVGIWVVDPSQVKPDSVLLGRDAKGHIADQLSPGTTITDGIEFVLNSAGRYALWTGRGFSYDREFLTQIAPAPAVRPFPIIPDYDITERIKFRGGLTCRCVAISLPWVEYAMLQAGVIKFNIDIYQLGYRTDVEASKGTHARGGNTDVGQYSDLALAIWRSMGWAMQRREPPDFSYHAHGWPKGCPHLSPGRNGGEWQATEWNAGRNGLRGQGRITGPKPTGNATPNFDAALAAYIKKVGTPATIN